MDSVFKVFEEVTLWPQKYSSVFQYDSNYFEKMIKMFETGICFPLTNRNEKGERIVFFKIGKCDTSQFQFQDMMRLLFFVHMFLSEEKKRKSPELKQFLT